MTTTTHTHEVECECADFSRSRRRFLGTMGATAGAGVATSMFGSAFFQASFAATDGAAKNVLVVLSMRGGADGMSLIVPYADAGYYNARPNLGVPEGALLAKGADFGLHPSLAPLVPMWTAGQFAAVHAVGLAVPNRSHFAAMELIEDADPGSSERRGWLNRLIGLNTRTSPLEAAQLGSALVPTSLYGPEPVLAVSRINDMFLPGRKQAEAYARRVASLKAAWDDEDTALGRGALGAVEVSKTFEALDKTDTDPHNEAVYENDDLGDALAEAARLIRGNLGVQVITIDAGAWDMHVGLGTLGSGAMVGEAKALATNIAAFFKDIGTTLAASVTVATVSEFGRRLAENDSRGLDHGWGNAMLLLGAGVKGGKVYGNWPGLDAADLVEGDLKVTRDYRSVLAEILRSRFKSDISKVFPNFTPEKIGVMRNLG